MFASVVCAFVLALVWIDGTAFNIPTVEAKKTVNLWILGILIAILLLHAITSRVGAYKVAGFVFRRNSAGNSKADVPRPTPELDDRLQSLCDELRMSQGYFWRSHLPWLMLTGRDDLINEVAPGLKQAAVMHIADTILVHAVPDGIDAARWRKQIRQLRRRRPIDTLVQVTRMGDGIRPDSELPRKLATIAMDLRWAAPVTFLHAVKTTGNQPERFEAIGAFVTARTHRAKPSAIGALSDDLIALEQHTADAGVTLCCAPQRIRYLAEVSAYISSQREHIVTGWTTLIASKWLRAPLAGVMFAPVFSGATLIPLPVTSDERAAHATTADALIAVAATSTTAGTLRESPPSLLPIWQRIGHSARLHSGKRVGFYWPNALAALAMTFAIIWCVAMTISLIGNRQLFQQAQASTDAALAAPPGTPAALRTQLALQQQIETLEYRRQHSAPWYLHAGLDRNDALLEALWRPYAIVATRNLQRPVVQSLETTLTDLAQIRADALQSHEAQRNGYNALKAYLMLAQPDHTVPTFLQTQILATWPVPAGMRTGEWLDTSQRVARFYASHLKAHPEWRSQASEALLSSVRNTLINQIGLANADDTVYETVLADARGKYADVSLVTLLNGTDARGLFNTTHTVPGIYTRVAWDGMIADAIDRASSERRVNGDWVLSGAQPFRTIGNTQVQGAIRTAAARDEKRAADDLKQRLTERYFTEYAAAWQGMLNSIQWQPATNLNDAVSQLTRLTDAQTSPLIALMKSVQVQAQAARPTQALSETLVRKAQSLIGSDDKSATPAVNPLDKTFGPLLALMGEIGDSKGGNRGDGSNNTGNANTTAAPTFNGVSLAHYLAVATTMRLKLQQIAASPDAQAMARSLAQAVFQGKLSELAQARDDAALTAASLGTQWTGFGNALFTRPLDTAWQTILQPAAASLNDAWRAGIAVPFGTTFSGRYPFFDTTADAPFAELGRYVRSDTGLIARFVATQLGGVLKQQGDQWVPNELAPQALQFDPAFLAALRQLSTLGAQLYVQGGAGYRFEMMALATGKVTRTELTVDGKEVIYFNQREAYVPLTWPGNGLNGQARLSWQTVDAGLRQAFDSTGDWAFLRLLAKADVKPLDSTRYALTWKDGDTEPLRYVLRTQVGAGPLDLLELRGFRMPERIFIVGKGGALPVVPPLPPEMVQ